MFIPKGHLKGFFISTGLLGATVSAGVLASGSLGMFLKRNANESYDPRVLDNTNQPDLNNGSGTMTDAKGTIWEYSNADDYASGHVSLNHEGYVGISSTTPWGIPGITSITANFSTDSDKGELWLLKSVTGGDQEADWHEVQKLTSGTATTWANDWRYVRFFFWDDNSSHDGSVDIDSISISYTCADHDTKSAAEAVDSALVDNVDLEKISSNLTATRETSDLSPNSDGGEAIRITCSDGKTGEITIDLYRTFTIKEIAMCKLEFDMKAITTGNYEKKVQLLGHTNDNKKYESAVLSSTKTAFHYVSMGNSWYHVEVPVTCFATLISGYDKQDPPAKDLANNVVTSVKINIRGCVIDNLRFGSTPDIQGLGLYNGSNGVTVGKVYWIKVAGTGILHSCEMTYTTIVPNPNEPDAPIVEQVTSADPNLKNGSPFYIKGLRSGKVQVTVHIVNRYNRQEVSITTETLTVS